MYAPIPEPGHHRRRPAVFLRSQATRVRGSVEKLGFVPSLGKRQTDDPLFYSYTIYSYDRQTAGRRSALLALALSVRVRPTHDRIPAWHQATTAATTASTFSGSHGTSHRATTGSSPSPSRSPPLEPSSTKIESVELNGKSVSLSFVDVAGVIIATVLFPKPFHSR